MSDLINYYQNYYQNLGNDAYCMEIVGKTSRKEFFKDYIQKYAKEGDRILDVGCGDMYLSKVLPQYSWEGIDINTEKAPKAIKHDISSPPYPLKSDSFDMVVCSEVLEHVWDLNVIHLEVKRLLKRNGTYIVSTPNYDFIDHFLCQFRQLLFDDSKPHLYEHIRQYNLEVHERHLNRAGFSVQEFVGADAHYSAFFKEAREELLKHLTEDLNIPGLDLIDADKIIGKMFKRFNHTIIVVAKSL